MRSHLHPPPLPSPPLIEAEEGRATFRVDIEGLRGIAVLLVVLYHAGAPAVSGGFVGVDVFFVLSGFLITGLLVREVESTGRLKLLGFYARRARRLLPASALMLLVTVPVALLVFSPLEQVRTLRSALAAAAYVSNFWFIRRGSDYFDGGLQSDPWLHTWSLGVEEQFYLLWPLIVWALLRRGRRWLVLGMTASVVLTLAATLGVEPRYIDWVFFASPPRVWEFAVGGLVALIPSASRPSRRTSLALGWIGLLAILGSAVLLDETTRFPGTSTLFPVVGTATVLLAGAAVPIRGLGSVLTVRPLTALGRLSYGWYLWHWPVLVFTLAMFPSASWSVRFAVASLSLLPAALSYRWVENPIRYHPRLQRMPRYTLGLAGVTTLGLVLLATAASGFGERVLTSAPHDRYAAAAIDRSSTRVCAEWTDAGWSESCDLTPDPTRPAVVVFGDSHGAQWLPAVTPMAGAGWRVISMTRSACPAVEVPRYERLGGDVRVACDAWRHEALTHIASIKPDVVVLANSREHVEGPRRKDQRPRATVEAWGEGSRVTFAALDALGVATLFLRDTPRIGVVAPDCLSRADWPTSRELSCRSDREAAGDPPVFHAEVRAAAGLPRTTVVDLTDHFCRSSTCPAEIDGMVVYSDFDHITATFAGHLSPVVAEAIEMARRR